MEPGGFYLDREGSKWCCYKVNIKYEPHCQALAIRVDDSRIEYFYIDGRYDKNGESELSLISKA